MDGVALNEPYVFEQPTEPLTNSRIVFPVQVPDGYVWVMGDNRTASQHSRYFGPVAVSAIRGSARTALAEDYKTRCHLDSYARVPTIRRRGQHRIVG